VLYVSLSDYNPVPGLTALFGRRAWFGDAAHGRALLTASSRHRHVESEDISGRCICKYIPGSLFSFGHLIGTTFEAFWFVAGQPVRTKLQISLSWREVVLRNVLQRRVPTVRSCTLPDIPNPHRLFAPSFWGVYRCVTQFGGVSSLKMTGRRGCFAGKCIEPRIGSSLVVEAPPIAWSLARAKTYFGGVYRGPEGSRCHAGYKRTFVYCKEYLTTLNHEIII
jgi:hypothetical protein